MKALTVAGFALLALLGASEVSRAEECSRLLAPVSISMRDSGFDQGRAACVADDYSAGMRILTALDAPEYYGTISAGLHLEYHLLHASGFEFGIGARLLDYRFVQSVLFQATEASLGPVHLEVARPSARRWFGQEVVLTQALRVDLPLSTTSSENITVAASPSILASMLLSARLQLHGRLAALLWSVLPESGADGRAAVASSIDLGYAPASSFSLLLGTEVQGGWYGATLDHLQARAGLRVAVGEEGAFELSAASPLVGEERVQIGAVIWLGYRVVARPDEPAKRSRLQDWAQ